MPKIQYGPTNKQDLYLLRMCALAARLVGRGIFGVSRWSFQPDIDNKLFNNFISMRFICDAQINWHGLCNHGDVGRVGRR